MHLQLIEHARGGGYVDVKVHLGRTMDELETCGGLVMRRVQWAILKSALVMMERAMPAIKVHLPEDQG